MACNRHPTLTRTTGTTLVTRVSCVIVCAYREDHKPVAWPAIVTLPSHGRPQTYSMACNRHPTLTRTTGTPLVTRVSCVIVCEYSEGHKPVAWPAIVTLPSHGRPQTYSMACNRHPTLTRTTGTPLVTRVSCVIVCEYSEGHEPVAWPAIVTLPSHVRLAHL
ncbi:hypothetical protein J6590_086772 [Homalodisca vitripennis]|nr:hypothetical protein J6590_086772 [Homalodisca vitripennis]